MYHFGKLVISRRLILLTPVLLIAGIVVQAIALILVLVLWLPALAWPRMLNGPYQWISKVGAKMVARSILGRKSYKTADGRRVAKAETATQD
jgi:hypothetical protein